MSDAPQLTEAAEKQLLEANEKLLNAVAETARFQYVLVKVRSDHNASAEDIQKAAHDYRRTEAAAQEAISTLLEMHVAIIEAMDQGGGTVETLEPRATSVDAWRARNS